MSLILTGWYESEQGAVILDETGENLNEIVCRLVERDSENFGQTDMELELHMPDGEVKCVESLVHRMVNCYDS